MNSSSSNLSWTPLPDPSMPSKVMNLEVSVVVGIFPTGALAIIRSLVHASVEFRAASIRAKTEVRDTGSNLKDLG